MDAYGPSISASANPPTGSNDNATSASPVHTYTFTLSTSAFTPQFVKLLPDPLPLVSACPTGADLSNFDEEEDESTDDGNASVDATGDNGEEELDNTRGRAPLYYRMPVQCPTLPTLPIAVLSPEAVRNAELHPSRTPKPFATKNTGSISQEKVAEELKCYCCHYPVPPRSQYIITDCGHVYDIECLALVVQVSLKHTILPTCCGQFIPTRRFLHLLSYGLKKQFVEKEMEMMIDPSERLYCPKMDCLAFVGAVEANETPDLQSCPKCFTEICTQCRRDVNDPASAHLHRSTSVYQRPHFSASKFSPNCQPYHVDDLHDTEVLKVGRREGWQRCYQCRSMVEILEGCNHITCRCSAEFCYQCGRPWKPRSCSCGVFPNGS